jgi:pimeloyl-ACP methyl ester carboxylesterase
MKRGPLCWMALAFALVAPAIAAPAPAHAQSDFTHNPVVFVHGFFGSGAQFESQKMRLTSNGYPDGYVTVLEYDSTFGTETRQQVYDRLDQRIAALQQQTGKSQVDVVGHSLGTTLMHEYLKSSPARAASVAHYVNVDGRVADSPPGGVPTLAIWAGRGDPGREIGGAENVTLPNQTHVQAATSAESFRAMYQFFTGATPLTDQILPETEQVTIAGRAVAFPQNRGLTASAVEIWAIDHATGQRIGAAPAATVPVEADGSWGPVGVEPGQHYEFALVRPGVATLHYYYEPFIRSDHLVRLLYSDVVEAIVPRSEAHVSALVLRYKELWGDQGDQNDSLTFNGIEACNAETCPISNQVNAVFAFDRGLDGESDLSAPDPVFSELPFITGVDIFMPADRPPAGTVSVSLQSRGGGPARTLTFPNFPSTTDGAVLQFNDFEQADVTTAGANARCRIEDATIVGTDGKDVITGTPQRDVILVGRGRDVVRSGGGADLVCGQGGRDKLRASTGRDVIRAGKGADRASGGKGADKLKGGKGRDKLNGGKGRDKLNGGKGRDVCGAGPGRDAERACERG